MLINPSKRRSFQLPGHVNLGRSKTTYLLPQAHPILKSRRIYSALTPITSALQAVPDKREVSVFQGTVRWE